MTTNQRSETLLTDESGSSTTSGDQNVRMIFGVKYEYDGRSARKVVETKKSGKVVEWLEPKHQKT